MDATKEALDKACDRIRRCMMMHLDRAEDPSSGILPEIDRIVRDSGLPRQKIIEHLSE